MLAIVPLVCGTHVQLDHGFFSLPASARQKRRLLARDSAEQAREIPAQRDALEGHVRIGALLASTTTGRASASNGCEFMFWTWFEHTIVCVEALVSDVSCRSRQVMLHDNDSQMVWPSDYERFHNPEDYLERPNTLWLHERYPMLTDAARGVKSRPSGVGRRAGEGIAPSMRGVVRRTGRTASDTRSAAAMFISASALRDPPYFRNTSCSMKLAHHACMHACIHSQRYRQRICSAMAGRCLGSECRRRQRVM